MYPAKINKDELIQRGRLHEKSRTYARVEVRKGCVRQQGLTEFLLQESPGCSHMREGRMQALPGRLGKQGKLQVLSANCRSGILQPFRQDQC